MRFKQHYNLERPHAFLSASKYAWINYEDDQLDRVYASSLAAKRGDELHDYAATAIRLKRKQPRTEETLNRYINDAIGYRMTPEQLLWYSERAYGTTDAISFRQEKGHVKTLLRIHDLKTGITPASFSQHKIYAALFCHEYHQKPFDIDMEFRIYQNDAVAAEIGDPDEIVHIMEKMKRFDRRLLEMEMEAQGL